jgi:branched-chain amino acid transport system permease protein
VEPTTATVPATQRATPSPPRAARARDVLLARAGWPVVGVLAVLTAVLIQPSMHGGQERTISAVFMYVALAQSWNIIGGFTGYASFGQVAFFGVGGYTTAALMRHAGMSFWFALPLSALLAGAFAAVVGGLLLRLRGHYFAIATLAVAVIAQDVVTNTPSITGGGAGITIPTFGDHVPTKYPSHAGFYYMFLSAAALSTLIVAMLARSRFGYALRAINQNEAAAAAAAINTTRAKVIAFALAACITGAVGGIFAFQTVTFYPDQLFNADITVLMVIMVIMGGSGTVVGPVIGAVTFQYVSEYLRQHYTNAHTFILGAFIIVAVVLLPQGIVNFSRDAVRNRRIGLLDNVRRYRL